ncbi:hypothetical protein V8F06_012846 [Rhypophila decipiens]
MDSSEVFDDIQFLSLSSLLAINQGQQEPACKENDGGDTESNISTNSEDRDGNSENDSSIPHQLPTLTRKEWQQLKKVLDYIAETFSREKSVPFRAKRHVRRRGQIQGKGASHVTAAGLTMTERKPTIFIAKNGGPDAKDEDLARSLTIWIRAIAATGTRRDIEKDIMWTKLLDYSKQRLDLYATHIKDQGLELSDLAAAFAEGSDGPDLVRDLHRLSTQYEPAASPDLIQRMVSAAYRLRYEPPVAILSSKSKRLRNSVLFLGRLRSAYEGFNEAAIVFKETFKALTVTCLGAPTAQIVSRAVIERQIDVLAKKHTMSKPGKDRINKLLGKSTEVLIPCHAEIQLLEHFEGFLPPNADRFPYFGCSKKSCWLCQKPLYRYKAKTTGTRGFYQTRSSHGRVYPLWSTTLGSSPQTSDPWVRLRFLAALLDVETLIVERLQAAAVSGTQIPGVAESSANITVTGGPLKRRALAKQRLEEPSRTPRPVQTDVNILKDFACSKMCLRIPATSSESPHLLSINFYNYPDAYPAREPSPYRIPDFGPYWESSNFERAFRRITMKGQQREEMNGEYLFYWCTNDSFPPNAHLMSILGVKALGVNDHFWNGDVFLTRFHENDVSFEFHCEDVSHTCLADGMKWLKNIIREFWAGKELEMEIRAWQDFNVLNEKMKADEEILLARM